MKLSKFLILLIFLLIFNSAFAQEQDTEWLKIISPVEGEVIIDKKPVIKAEFTIPIKIETLLVLLDGVDVTQVVTFSEKGFEYMPVFVLTAGDHNLNISSNDIEGRALQKEISFRTKHSKILEEVYATNEASVNYESVLKKPEEDKTTPYTKLEGNISSTTKVKERGNEVSFTTNIRYLDQSEPVSSPLYKGFQIANWLLKRSFSKDSFTFRTDVGDIQVNETPYTISSLSRRGGLLNFAYNTNENSYNMNIFSMKGYNVFGFRGGFGIGSDIDDHILGISGGMKLLSERVEFKTIYISGGEPGSSFGISTTSGAKKGDVVGFLLLTNLLQDRLRTELETDFSRFDPDTSDKFDSTSDKALKFKINGYAGKFLYDLIYEYIGRDYVSIGNQGLQKDKQGFTLTNSLNLGLHNINFLLSRYNDNVRGDRLFPRIFNYQGSLDYSCNAFPFLPFGINYQKSIQDSTREP